MANEQAIATQNTHAKIFNEKVQNALNNRRDTLAALLPEYLKPERMIQLTMMAIYRTPKLMECDPATVVASVITAAELGLELSGVRGEGYLIPRWNSKSKSNECQFQPGYRGLLKLANNSGDLKSIHAYIVRENEYFEYELGVDVKIVHRPGLGDRGKALGAYCAGRQISGEPFGEVMTFNEIEAIRARSQAGDFGPWKTDWDEMARKTVLKRKLKTLPNSSEKLHRAIELDNSEYEISDVDSGATAKQLTVAETLALPAAVGSTEPPAAADDPKPKKGKAKAEKAEDTAAPDVEAEEKRLRELVFAMYNDMPAKERDQWLQEHDMQSVNEVHKWGIDLCVAALEG